MHNVGLGWELQNATNIDNKYSLPSRFEFKRNLCYW